MPRPTITCTCICRHCGVEFSLPQWRINMGRGEYCGQPCYKAARKEENAKLLDRQEKRCPKCGATKPRGEFSEAPERGDGLAGHCKPCVVERTGEWGRENRDQVNAVRKVLRAGRPEKERAQNRAWYAADPERGRAKQKQYRESHPDQLRATNKTSKAKRFDVDKEFTRNWRKQHPDSVRQWARNHELAKNNIPGTHTEGQWLSLCAAFDNRCVCCGDRAKLTRDHIIPVTRKGSTDNIDNIQSLCVPCNSRKGNRLLIDYRQTPFIGEGIKVEAA